MSGGAATGGRLEPIQAADDPRLAVYRDLRDPQLRRDDLFIVEGRHGVRRLVAGGRFRPHSLLLTPAARAGLGDTLRRLPAGTPVYLASRELLCGVVGYNLHRGCIAAAERGAALAPERLAEACARAGRSLVVLEDVTNPENVGNLFRNAEAFGAGGVWLTPRCADPLYRQATRVSMGGSLRLPFARVPAAAPALPALRAAGFTIVALTPHPAAEEVGAAARRLAGRPLALLLGSEDGGLGPAVLAAADHRVRIPLAPGVDSLNVATASGIALHRFAEHAPS